MTNLVTNVASRFLEAGEHRRSVALMKFLSGVANRLGVGNHVYVVGGAVRNFLMGIPPKDIDVVIDSVSLGRGRNSEWFVGQVARGIPVATSIATNQYGVAILTVSGTWLLDGEDMQGEVIEVANARKESYSGVGGKGKGYKPDDVQPATIEEDVVRREFTVNTLMWRLLDLTDGPERAEVLDLTGLGRQHLEERVLQTPMDPDRTFADDPTRILRLGKFLLKYGLKPTLDVEAAARRNAHRLADMPWEAVANILVKDILDTPKARAGLLWMASLGIVDVLAQMIQTTKPMATFMAGQMTADKDVQLLLDLAGLGLGDRPVSFLSPEQRSQLRGITFPMPREEASAFLAGLRSPPIDNLALISEFNLQPRDRGVLAPTARQLLLAQPGLIDQPDALTDAVRRALRMTLLG